MPVSMSEGVVLKSALKVLALAVVQGLVIGTCLGVSVLIFIGRLDEYLVPVCEFDRAGCQVALTSAALPFPRPIQSDSCRPIPHCLTGALPFCVYAKSEAPKGESVLRAERVSPCLAFEGERLP